MFLNSFLKLVVIHIFVGVHIVQAWVFVYFYLINHVLVNLGSEDLFVVFVGLEDESVGIFLLSHFFYYYKLENQ